MGRHPGQQKGGRVRMTHPVRAPGSRDLPGQVPAQSRHQVIDAAGPPRREPGAAGQVHEHRGGVQVRRRQVGAGLAELPRVLPVKGVQLVGDEHPPVALPLDPHPVRVLTGNDLDERRAAAARVPVPVLQAQGLAQPQPRLGKKQPQQPVPHPALPLPARRAGPGARVADRRDLGRGQHRRRRPPRHPHPHRAPAPARLPREMIQHRLVDGTAAVHDPGQVTAERHAVQLVEPVARRHRPQPGADRRLGEPRLPRLDRHHHRAVAAAQPRQEPAHVRQRQRVPRQAEQRQVRPPQRQRPRVRLHRVRRRALHPQVLQELLRLPDHRKIGTEDRPRRLAARQHDTLRPALPVNVRHTR